MRQASFSSSSRPPRRAGRHLVRRGQAFVFQKRIPSDLDPSLRTAPIRVPLGVVPIREARRRASILAAAAEFGFDALRNRRRKMSEDQTEAFLPDAADWRMVNSLLLGLNAAAENDAEDVEVARKMVAAGFDGLFALGEDRLTGSSALFAVDGPRLEEHYIRVIGDEATGRAHLGLPPMPALPPRDRRVLDEIAAGQAAMAAEQATLVAELARMAAKDKAKQGQLFSEASAAYCEELAMANGEDDGELGYLRHRTKIFIELIGDKPVTAYTKADLVEFVCEVRHLPPNISKTEADYDIKNVRKYIAKGKKSGEPGLSKSTLVNNYLGKVKTILKSGCEYVGVPFALQDVRIRIPKGVPMPKQKLLLDYDGMNRLFRAGVETGNLGSALLPPLGFVAGRRIGQLAWLRREDIFQLHGVWVVVPRPVVKVDGECKLVPFKTGESLKIFVLHDMFERIGLIAYLKSLGPGFIFEELHERIKDPADTAQKRMATVYDAAEVNREIFKAFHGLRHSKINYDREIKLPERVSRLQVGHELGDDHMKYGLQQLSASELREVANARLPDEVDWSIFDGLDFEKLSKHRVTRGRKKKG
jgi:hypothetical protein